MKNYAPELIYETVTYEQIVKEKREKKGLESIPYDKDSFHKTDIWLENAQSQGIYKVFYDDPMNQAVIHYWANKGLKKELFDNDGKYGFEAPNAFSVFTPLDMDLDKKYAMIYLCHDDEQPIEAAENYGFNTLASREHYIVVYANNGGPYNDAVDIEFPRILSEIQKIGYPVDWERVYVAGISSGSSAAAVCAYNNPEIVAAIGCMPDGIPFTSMSIYNETNYYNKTKGLRVPGIFIGGKLDRGDFPAPWILDYDGNELNCGTIDNGVENLNIWMRDIAKIKKKINATKESICNLLKNSDNSIVREFGLDFDRTYSFRAQGTNWVGGDFYGIDNAPVMRWVRANEMPSIVSESEINIIWDYLKHFRRNQSTGESIYDPFVCWGDR